MFHVESVEERPLHRKAGDRPGPAVRDPHVSTANVEVGGMLYLPGTFSQAVADCAQQLTPGRELFDPHLVAKIRDEQGVAVDYDITHRADEMRGDRLVQV